MKRRILIIWFLLIAIVPAGAETFRADADWWARGSGDGVSIDDQGRLTSARRLERSVDPDPGAVWDLASHGDAIWSAWSEPGRLMKLQGRELETVLTLDNDRWISAVTVDADGEPWYAIAPGGTLQNGIDVGAKYVWDLLSLQDGGLLIATGEPGFVALWDGALSTVLSFTEQESARALAEDAFGNVWIGTSISGQLWRWDRKTDPFLVGQLAEREFVSLTTDDHGGVWILHTKSAADTKTEKPKAVAANGEKPKTEESKNDRDTVLSHWSPSEGFREIWQQEKETPYAMVRQHTDLWIGSGPEGRLRRVSAEGRVLEGYTLPVQNVSALAAAAGGGLAIGSSGDGMLASLLSSRRKEGRWSGPVIDAGAPAHWGRMDATLEGDVQLEVRVGNLKIPDTGWTTWTAVDAGAAAPLPIARFGQLRVRLVSGRKQAAVSEVAWTWTLRNRAPRIGKLHAEPAGTIWYAGPPPSRNSGGPVIIGDPVATETTKRVKPKSRTIVKKAYEPGTQTVVWEVEDADGDNLRARLTLIAADGRRLSIHEGPSLGFHAFDVRALPEGDYLVELKVEDPQGGAEIRQGAKFRVDRTAPVLKANKTSRGWQLVVTDAEGLRSVDRRHNDRWIPIIPRDGIVDGHEETFDLTDVEGAGPVWIRAVDRSGNVHGSWIGGA